MEWLSRGLLDGLEKKASQNWESTNGRSESKLSKDGASVCSTTETFLGKCKDSCQPNEQVSLCI